MQSRTPTGERPRRILVAYASWTGTTPEVAQAIASSPAELGNSTDAIPIDQVTRVDDYDAVIIGSPIQYDRWLPEAIGFMKTHRVALKERSVVGFFTCLTLSRGTQKAQSQANRYAEVIHRLDPDIDVLDVGRFAGVLDYRRLNPLVRPLARIIFLALGVREGDHRDWTAIDRWARALDRRLRSSLSGPALDVSRCAARPEPTRQ
jgi:menaquinone-dependent protoporphyrinogen oxidase